MTTRILIRSEQGLATPNDGSVCQEAARLAALTSAKIRHDCGLAHAAATIAAAFLASLVEFVEALTIVLAVGIERGWRPALIASAPGLPCWRSLC